ncbi:MAG: iron ABC transporter permease [Alphaproteobacteria bacterium]|nr:iron ABC transporter permease [Alphaproteobacteria bacterium]
MPERSAVRAAKRRRVSAELVIGSLLLGVVGYFVVPPLLMLVYGSLTDTPPEAVPNFTVATLMQAYGARTTYRSLTNSLIYAFTTATFVIIIGGFLAWAAERTDAIVRNITDLFVLAPILMPAVMLVSGWIMLLGPGSGIVNMMLKDLLGTQQAPLNLFSLPGMIWVGILQELPLAFLWLWPAFRAMNPALEEAALMAGASNWNVLRRITLPILLPTIYAAWLICFIFALGALSVPLLLGLPSGILFYSTEIYLVTTRFPSDLNAASAYCLLYLVTVVLGLALYRRATRDASRFVTITGKGYTPRRIELGLWRHAVNAAVIFVLFLVAGLPMLVLIWSSLMPFPQPPSIAALSQITLQNFPAALNYGPAKRAVINSLVLGLGAGVITTVLGAAIAWFLLRTRHRRLGAWIDQLSTAPIALPGILVGVSLLWTYIMIPLPIYATAWILLIAYITLHIPYSVRICVSALSQIHRELDEAAMMAGARRFTTLRRIIFPLMASSLAVSVVYVMLRSFREYSASIFLTGVNTEVFSVLVLDMWAGGVSNVLAAYVTMVMGLLIVATSILQWAGARAGIKL